MSTSFRKLFNEMGRRGVLKAAGIYLAGAWVLIQVADVILAPLGLPSWVFNLLIWLVVIGFPFTLAFSWRFDVSLDGISLTPPMTGTSAEALRLRKRDFTALAVVATLVGVFTFYLADLLRGQQAEITSAGSDTAPEHSIAVLPFENLGGDADNYLGMGLAEDILHRLASIPGMPVASRTASFELDRSNLSMPEIGRRLNVRNVLEGSVRREGDRVRVVAQLIDARTNYHLWSSRYDRRIEDLFAIYDEISTALATELQLTLAPDTELIRPPPTVDMQAYDYFLQARSILQRASSADNVANAQRFFANAVERDPDFADAWAGQCRAWLEWYQFEASANKITAAESSCRRALELSPDLAEGHVALGDLYRIIGAYEQAVTQYQEAIKSNSELPIAWRGIGQAFEGLERAVEAERALSKAVDYNPDDLLSLHALGDFYFYQGKFEKAQDVYARMTEHPQADARAFNTVGSARLQMNDFEGAAAAFRQVIALEPTAVAYSNIGVIYYTLGRFDDAVVMAREAVGLDPDDPINWMNLGDFLRQTEHDATEQQDAYRRAAALLEDLLAVNARDVELLTNLAHCYARLGDDHRAMELIDQSLQITTDDYYTHYYASLAHLEAGRTGQALEAITRAVELNYPIEQLRNDPQFEALSKRAEFQSLLGDAANPGDSN